jgi:putative ABC transport system permease protein
MSVIPALNRTRRLRSSRRWRPWPPRRWRARGRKPRIAGPDLVLEAIAGVLQRPGRAVLTMAGTTLAMAAFVAILGLTTTAAAQIGAQFSVFTATQVTVTDTGDSGSTAVLDFPADADQRIDALHGVVGAGVYWQVDLGSDQVGMSPFTTGTQGLGLQVYAVTPGLLSAAGAALSSGVLLNAFYQSHRQPVALLGAAAAAQLGVSALSPPPVIFIGGNSYTVIGILSSTPRLPALGLAVVIPSTLAEQQYGPPQPATPAVMIIHTRLGAAQLIASQAAIALRPDDPQLLSATAAPDLGSLQRGVAFTVNGLFLFLASVTLAVGALGIANTALVAVLERTAEIGLRRALGASRKHIALQVLTETGTLGLVGALGGTTAGILITIAVGIARHWTVVLNPAFVYTAPPAGLAVGLVAGLYPALRAAFIQPSDALRR